MIEANEAVYDIIDWLRHDTDIQSVLGVTNANDAHVFFPSQQDPKGGFPYVRYLTSTTMSVESFWRRYDHIMMAAFFEDVMDSARFMNIVMDKVKAGDESARDLNKFLRDMPGYTSPYDFKHLEWVDGGAVEPTEERGGAHARMVTFRASYVVHEGLGIDR